MKVIILAGGLGTRIMEETDTKPKPMVLIDERPILWHVMSIFAAQGYSDFVIATGYKHEVIEEWVQNIETDWVITPYFTGQDTQTGGRVKKCIEAFQSDRYFMTYGDGLANVNLARLLSCHKKTGCTATVTAVRPPARFGVLQIEVDRVSHFGEKQQTDTGWINGGFFVLEKNVVDSVTNDSDLFETYSLPKLALSNNLAAYKHYGFWQPMDTLRERNMLTELANHRPKPWLDIGS